MENMLQLRISCLIAFLTCTIALAEPTMQSHPPIRPLATPTTRPLGTGPAYFVDPAAGDDKNDGGLQSPWRTLQHGMDRLRPGDTLVLRGGTYYEHAVLAQSGTSEAPITIRGYPGEVSIIDGGFSEFCTDPAHAWEPYPDGGEGEYRSIKSYKLSDVCGNLGDSMVPLRIYGSFVDLRAAGQYEVKGSKAGVYVGPGLKQDPATGRIHVRLAHTTLKGLGEQNYVGQTDPRKLPLVICADEPALNLRGARHVRLHGLVFRGGSPTVKVEEAEDLQLDGITLYAGKYGLWIWQSRGVKVFNSALRGFDAPWHPRSSGTDVDCFCPLDLVNLASGGDFELAYNELTDHHDCIQIGDIESLSFHHNLVEHFNDDGIDIDLSKVGTYTITQNRISRCLTPISIHGASVAVPGHGLYITRNVFDLRRGTYTVPPSSPETDDAADLKSFSREPGLIRDHASPIWPPVYFYHNTVLQSEPIYRNQYGSGAGYLGVKDNPRRVFNNLFVYRQMFDSARPAVMALPAAGGDLQVDGNLFWGLQDGPTLKQNPLDKFRKSKGFSESQKSYPRGWTSGDLVADPALTRLEPDVSKPTDLTLQPTSPAINAGVPIPQDWPDPLREPAGDLPDLGAIPAGGRPWPIGIHGQRALFP